MARIGNVLPLDSTVVNANVKVPGVRRFGAGFTATTLPFTVAPCGTTTVPEASRTSVATFAVKVSPGLFFRELSSWLIVRSRCVPAGTVRDTGRSD